MAKSTLPPASRHMAQVHALGHPSSPPPQTRWARPGKGRGGEPGVNLPQTGLPNTPAAPALSQDSGTGLIVTWSAPATDSTHGAATGYVLRYSPSGAGTWVIVPNVNSPCDLVNLGSGAAFDVQIQAANAIGASLWSPTATLTTATQTVLAPNVPAAPSLAQDSGSGLMVTWAAPAVDATHGAATSFALRSSPAGAGTWTVVSNMTSPYDLASLTAGAACDVQVQASNTGGTSAWSSTSTLTTASAGPYAPNAPAIASVTPPPDGTAGKLSITWTAPAVDGTHGAATGYNLRWSPQGAGTWTTVTGVASPYSLTGLTGGAAIDVEVQGTNAAASPGAWSSIVTGTSWGATVVPGIWSAASSQVHNTSVAPNGGVQVTAAAAPTTVASAAFAWSPSNTTVPTSGLITAPSNGQTNGWGQWFNAPATAGTWYLWCLAQNAGGGTIGALVTSAITVT